MKVYLIADTHFNHDKIKTYCDRPENFTETIVKRWQETVKSEDVVIHLGDVFIGPKDGWEPVRLSLPGHKILVRGNHDRGHSNTWWVDKGGFDFSCDGMMFRNCWLSHEPAKIWPEGTVYNIHGHLHNVWDGFHPDDPKVTTADESFIKPWETKQLMYEKTRLFAVEYTNYRPVEFDKFLSNPERYKAIGENKIWTGLIQ